MGYLSRSDIFLEDSGIDLRACVKNMKVPTPLKSKLFSVLAIFDYILWTTLSTYFLALTTFV